MKHLPFATVGFIATFVGITTFFSSTLFAADNAEGEKSRLASLAKFTRVLATIEKYYVDDIKIDDIVKKSIEGLLTNLDAHSSYLDEKHFKDLKIQTDGEFGGLGITVGQRDGALTVIAPMEGTPADKAGVKAGDIILKINKQSTLNMTIDEAVNIMRGKPNTSIELTLVREGENKPLTISIVRDIIKIESVYSKIIENENILYVRVVNFDKNIVGDVQEAINKHKNVKGIVLDLRNNPGGLLNQAVGLVDIFVDEGIIVSQKGRVESENAEYKATKSGTNTKLPLVVLVNGGSASASEIVSGALQDHKRAIIIGEKTFGKGSVQAVLPVVDNEAIRLTIARYYLPSGRTIQAEGVTPDITVYPGDVPTKANEQTLKEKDLKKHLEGELKKVDENKTEVKETKPKAKTKEAMKADKEIVSQENLFKDLQLKSAVDAIKILAIKK
ncbi:MULTISPECIES: S41 family peptidase [Sulfurospirillum]|uniref:Carboxy-terminal-processing protease n=3 Tax=Sulfurospirillum TaxID=57665 RepID=A0A1D7TKK9_9BACT|nr:MULTISPECIES: S41 family peptidase [Sulfurospirillum]AHJ13263.1 carboxy-terminal-processing protease [Sulfurospirillum multivorans DSM 12446]AOO65532.1 carboxy-terminal-processing protease [Sulfurospirillum halorespirans DSM 13726]QEH06753.1 carboxy-terminal-processing protease [Sulfurospirillum multivorans]